MWLAQTHVFTERDKARERADFPRERLIFAREIERYSVQARDYRMSLDESHEQNNPCAKEQGGAIGLTQTPTALLKPCSHILMPDNHVG